MKHLYLLVITLCLSTSYLSSQTHFREGYDISFDVIGAIPSRDMVFFDFPGIVNDYFTGGNVAPSGGLKHLTKTKANGLAQSILNMDNGSALDIDFGLNPYATIRVQSTANTDIVMSLTLKGTNSVSRSFTIKGNNTWNVIRLDFGDQIPLIGGSTNELHWGWTEPPTTTYPYELYFDYIRLGGIDNKGNGATLNTGDPDSTVKLSLAGVATQLCEKDGGQQSLTLSGITNGIDVANLSLSQTNSKSTLFESVTFENINTNGTCVMNYTPKAGVIGVSNMHVVLTYNRADTVKKYKSIWFDIRVSADPVAKVPAVITAQMNQTKVTSKLTGIMNSVGSTDKLTLEVTSGNPDLITNLKADAVKSDGTAIVSFIPGIDKSGKDTIIITLTDTSSNRTQIYKVLVAVVDPNDCGLCEELQSSEQEGELIFANPATSDKLFVKVPSDRGGKICIVDIHGRSLIENIVPEGQSEIEITISHCDEGVYFVIYEVMNQRWLKKLFIK